MMICRHARDLEVAHDADVFVAGGGPSGVTAGAAAALAAENGGDVRGFDVRMLQPRLLGLGAFLPRP